MSKASEFARSTITGAKAGAIVLASLLAACTVGPDYHRPDLNLPGDYGRAAPVAPLSSAPSIASQWWKQYHDPVLDGLVESALANNADILSAVGRVDEARAVLRETNASLFPAFDASGTGSRQRLGVASTGGTGSSTSTSSSTSSGASTSSAAASSGVSPTASSLSSRGVYLNLFQLEGSVSYELDLWGRLRRLSESARASLVSSVYARDVTALSLASTVTQSYFTLRSLDAQIKVTQNTLAAVSESQTIAKKRLDAGYASALDYSQAETLRAQTAVQLRDLRRQRILQEHQIAMLTANLSLSIEPGTLDALPIPVSPPPGLPSTLLERRPDVKSAEQSVVSTNAQIGAAKAQLFPTFSLTGAFGGQSLDLSDVVKAPFRIWNIGLGITQPIFAGGRYLAQVDQARAVNDQQLASYQKTVQTAFQEVSDALTNVDESNKSESEVQAQVDAARRYLHLSQLRYQQGYAEYLDVLDATRSMNTAELTLVQNRQARLVYSVDLLKALGGGWDEQQAGTVPAAESGAATRPGGAAR
jgi:multidrug efflux system outer membrane protein